MAIINDGMGKFVADQTVKHIIQRDGQVKSARMNLLGLIFRELRGYSKNQGGGYFPRGCKSFGVGSYLHDPVASAEEAWHEYEIYLLELPRADGIIVAVAHDEFVSMPLHRILGRVAHDAVSSM